MKKILLCLCFCLMGVYGIAAEETGRHILSLRGHLSEGTLSEAKKELNQLSTEKPLVVEIQSTSGNFQKVFDFSKELHRWREQWNQKIVVYIDGAALGPSALVPLLADELFCSPFATWGDILLSVSASFPVHVLESQVRNLVMDSHPQRDLMLLIAKGMVDEKVVIIDENGWKRGEGKQERGVVSSLGERLVLEKNQMIAQGIVSQDLPIDLFRRRFEVSEEEGEALKKKAEKKGSLVVQEEALLERIKEHIPFDSQESNRIGHILIDDRTQGITQGTWIYVKSALDYYRANPPALIILELNTPGGEVFSSQKISDALKEMDTQLGVPVVAYINNWAISAGAMLAYSCRFIAVAKDGSMGAAEPVFSGGGGQMQAAPEKINSALQTDFANRAGFFERNPYLAEAMVDKSVILVLRYGEIVKLDRADQIRTEGVDRDEIICGEGELLTLGADDLIRYGVADLLIPPTKTAFITEEERDRGSWPASKEELFSQPLLNELAKGEVDAYRPDWKVQFLSFLVSPAVASLLFLGMMLGFYVEINTPGVGFPGSVALVCMALILISSFALDVVHWLEVALLLVGLALLAVEVLVIPGFGVAGISGLVLALVGLFAVMLPGLESVSYDVDTQTLNAAGEVFLERLGWLCGSLIVGTLSMFLLGRYVMPELGAFQRLVLEEKSPSEPSLCESVAFPEEGVKGETETPLRPAGKVRISGELYDGLSAGGFIPAQTKIVVVRTEGNRLFVEEAH